MSDPNSSMTPAILYVEPDAPRFQDDYRRWQGIPSIEVTEKGRIFVNFFSGQGAEVGGNFLMLCTSDNRGETFRSCVTVIEHPDPLCRIYDPCLWISPAGELWMIYNQTKGFNDCPAASGPQSAKRRMHRGWSGRRPAGLPTAS